MKESMVRRVDNINRLLEDDKLEIVYQDCFRNNEKKGGYMLKGEEGNCFPVIYEDHEIWKESNLEVVAFLKNLFKTNSWELEIAPFIKREYIVEHVRPRVYSEKNRSELERLGIAAIPLLDMMIAFYVPIGEVKPDGSIHSFNITDIILHASGLDLDELFQIANHNAMKDCRIMSLLKLIEQFMGESLETEEIFPMLVVTNGNQINGAGVIASDEVMREIAETLGSPFVILPSSVHEIICIPYSLEIENLVEMVSDINENHVRLEDRLTDSVYIWEDGKLGRYKE